MTKKIEEIRGFFGCVGSRIKESPNDRRAWGNLQTVGASQDWVTGLGVAAGADAAASDFAASLVDASALASALA
jgi:hypothetical protein